jgi:hypothetical protein
MKKRNSWFFKNLLLVVYLIGSTLADCQAQTKKILDLKVDSFKTELEEIGNSFWVDDNQFVMTTLQRGAERQVPAEDSPSRIALVNFSNRTINYIADDAHLVDSTFDHKTRSILIGKLHRNAAAAGAANKRATIGATYDTLREIRIERDGTVVEVKSYPAGSSLPVRGIPPPKDRLFEPLDNGRGGYLVRYLAPGDTYMRQWDRLIKNDEGYPTVWVREGKPDMPLPLRFDEISSGEYVAFLDKYLLNNYDTKANSNTDSHKNLVWRRPYEYTPFRLLGQDGSIQEIPYPEFVFEYGLSRRDKPDGQGPHFNDFLVTKAGIVIHKHREYGSALYLFRRDQLYLIAGGKTTLRVDLAENSAEGISSTELSPDGCKIAYSHLKELAASSKESAPHFFTIIDLCRDSK